MPSKRQQFIDLYKKGGKRKDYIDLAIDLGLATPKIKEELEMPSDSSYNRKINRTSKKQGGFIATGCGKVMNNKRKKTKLY